MPSVWVIIAPDFFTVVCCQGEGNVGQPFLGEIRIVAFNFAPKGWAMCNGGILAINQNQALFSLLGTAFGGNGSTTFGLPDQRGRVPIHVDAQKGIGTIGGEQSHTLSLAEMPQHTHPLQGTNAAATTNIPTNALMLGNTAPNDLYTGFAAPTALQAGTIGSIGGSQPHENMQPYLTLTFCIALQGIFPSQN